MGWGMHQDIKDGVSGCISIEACNMFSKFRIRCGLHLDVFFCRACVCKFGLCMRTLIIIAPREPPVHAPGYGEYQRIPTSEYAARKIKITPVPLRMHVMSRIDMAALSGSDRQRMKMMPVSHVSTQFPVNFETLIYHCSNQCAPLIILVGCCYISSCNSFTFV